MRVLDPDVREVHSAQSAELRQVRRPKMLTGN